MEAWRASRTARYGAGAESVLVRAWRHSAIGRLFGFLASWMGAAAAGSRVLALPPAVGRPLSLPGGPLCVRAVAAPYDAARDLMGGGLPGRTVRRVFQAVPLSAFARWRWLTLLGVALVGSAVGGVTEQVSSADGFLTFAAALAWGVVLVLGLLLSLAGPRLVTAARVSLSARTAGLLGSGLAQRTRRGAPEDVLSSQTVDASNLEAADRGPAERALQWTALAAAGVLGLLAGLAGLGPVVPALGLAVGLVAVAAVVYRPELLLIVLAAFPWIDWAARRSLGTLGGLWDELLIVGALGTLLFAAVVVRRWDLSTVPVTLPLLVAVAAAAGSVAVNAVAQGVAVYGLRVLFQPILFFYLGYLLPRDARWLRRTVGVFLAASLLLALHGLFQYATNAPMPASWVDAREAGSIGTRAYSIIENPNGLGAFLLMGTLVATGLALSASGARDRLALAGTALVLAAGVGVTFSRGAWLGLVVGLVAMAALAYRRLLAGMVAGGVLGVLLLPPAFLERLTFAFSAAYINKSLVAGRLLMWKVALVKAVENPFFGVGIGTFGGTTAFLWGYSRLWIDNFYLQLAAEGGFILLFAFLWLLLRVGKGIVAAHVRVSKSEDGESRSLLGGFTAGVFGAYAAVAFANLTAGVWETLVVGAGFWFLTGLAASLAVPRDPAVPREGDRA